MEQIKKCPVCGAERLERHSELESLSVPYAPLCVFERSVDTCAACGESGDFGDVNDDRVETALSGAVQKSVGLMIEDLSKRGLSMAYIERALGLPQRTLARWKNGECSASAVALLRIVRTYPWLTRVADSGYEPSCANATLVSEAVVLMGKLAEASGLQSRAHVHHGKDGVRVFAQFTPSETIRDSLTDSTPAPGDADSWMSTRIAWS